MKKEKGEEKRPPVPRYFPTNRDHSATGFSPQGSKLPHSKSPLLRGASGGKRRHKLPSYSEKSPREALAPNNHSTIQPINYSTFSGH